MIIRELDGLNDSVLEEYCKGRNAARKAASSVFFNEDVLTPSGLASNAGEESRVLIGLLNQGALVAGYQYVLGDEKRKRMMVSDVWVHPDFQHRGLASMLMENAIAHGRSEGAELIALDVLANNDSAIGLYKKHGFRRMGIYANVSGMSPSFRMVRFLEPSVASSLHQCFSWSTSRLKHSMLYGAGCRPTLLCRLLFGKGQSQ
ncbi:MAG: GNAT family N-acetyltransferase [Coriobacteriaceae bacterium]|nr:GNAT family N-acetyltransferase [Coriobacteriaceae bacterium]